VDAAIYWGHQLTRLPPDVETSGDLQDAGVQFRVAVRVF
jgi:hypothetical protein